MEGRAVVEAVVVVVVVIGEGVEGLKRWKELK